MNSRLIIPLLCAGAVALACGSWSHTETSLASAEAAEKRDLRKERVAARDTHDAAAASRHMRAKTDTGTHITSAFAVNVEPHALRFALDLTNRTTKRVELAFPSGQEYDFIVLDANDREVYRWGATRMFTQSMQNKLLGGGESVRMEERVETTLPHGTYVAVATLKSSNFPVSARVPFELR